MEYADDIDFLDEDTSALDMLQPIAAENLKAGNLFRNESKADLPMCILLKYQKQTRRADCTVETKGGGKGKPWAPSLAVLQDTVGQTVSSPARPST